MLGRQLYRIEEGRWLAGVCVGISAHTGLDVDWVRALFIILMLFTAGIALLVYAILMLVLPVKKTLAEYAASEKEPG